MKIENSHGESFYGMHFYPGVAEYAEPDGGSFRVFINEDTIRKMSPTFKVRPVYVDHVDGVDDDINEVRKDADGWVIRSFFNESDGKTWVEFIVVSERGLEAIRRGYKLSNAYHPTSFGPGGVWNGVEYDKEITDAEYEHLAIVQDPRYSESIIMTPDQFKAYNEDKQLDLKRLSNSKGEQKMKLNLFKRQKVENSTDYEGLIVELPLSKKEISITKLVNEYDKIMNMNGYACNEHMVKLNDNEEMSVGDLVKKHKKLCDKMNEMEKSKNDDSMEGGEPGDGEMDGMENEEDDMDSIAKKVKKKVEVDDDDEPIDNEALDIDQMGEVDRGGDKSEMGMEEKRETRISKDAARKSLANKAEARAKALALKNAHRTAKQPIASVELSSDQLARGRERYGSGK